MGCEIGGVSPTVSDEIYCFCFRSHGAASANESVSFTFIAEHVAFQGQKIMYVYFFFFQFLDLIVMPVSCVYFASDSVVHFTVFVRS